MRIVYKLIKAFVPKADVTANWLPGRPYFITGFRSLAASSATATLTVMVNRPSMPKVNRIKRMLVKKFAPTNVEHAYMDSMIYMSNQSGKSTIAASMAYNMFYDTEGKTWKASSIK